jgi:plasmid replication initiation protein
MIDRPGFRVRNGVSSKIIWSLDPAIKAILANLEGGNFTPLILYVLGDLSLAATILTCECYKFRWHYKGKAFGSTKEMPIEYWYRALLGRWDVSNVKFGMFNLRTLTPAIEEVSLNCPFTVEFVPTIQRKAVVSGFFKIVNKPGETKPSGKKSNEMLLLAITDSQKEQLLIQFAELNIAKDRAIGIMEKIP